MREKRHIGGAAMRAFARDRGGAIAVLTALVMPVVIGVAAYAIDASLLLYRQERLQIAADVGAWAGAELLRDGRPDADAIAFAEALVLANVAAPEGSAPEITVTVPDPARVEITAALDVDRVFSQILGRGAFRILAASTAVIEGTDTPQTCLYIDDTGASGALETVFGARVTLTGCDAVVASTSSSAVTIMGLFGTALATDCLATAGEVSGARGITSDCPGIQEQVTVPPPQPLPDAPVPPRTCGANEDAAFAFARFETGDPSCGTVEITGNVTLPAGEYFLSGGNLEVGRNGRLTFAPGSVLVLMDTAQIIMEFRGELVIAAPTVGPLAGVAVMTGPEREGAYEHFLGRLDVEGRIALPGETVRVIGVANVERCTGIRAGRLTFGLGVRYTVACDGLQADSAVRLVPPDP